MILRYFLLLIFSSISFTKSALAVDLDDILKKTDELYRSKTSFAKMQMQIETPRWKRTMKMDIWTKGMDYTFVTVTYPVKDKGVSTLKREKDMWNFFPKINKVIKVPPSMMMSSWMGSDFTNDDLVKESSLRDDYEASLDENISENIYAITLVPKENVATVWGKIKIEIMKDKLIPLKQEFYDEKGIKVRIMTFSDVRKVGKRELPMKMELIPLTEEKKGHKTIISYEAIEFDLNIPESTFSRQNLQKRR